MGCYAPFISRKDAKGRIYPVFGMLRDGARRSISFFRENAENAEKRCSPEGALSFNIGW